MSIDTLKNKIPNYAKDIKLNLSTLLSGTEPVQLTKEHIAGIALASAYATLHSMTIQSLQAHAQEVGLTEEHITAIKAASSIMAMNNVYYRSVHFIQDESYTRLPSKLRMHILQQHGVTQQDFELYCLAVSAINGCGRCVDSHVNVLSKGGLGSEEIQYVLRVAAVVKAVSQVLLIEETVS